MKGNHLIRTFISLALAAVVTQTSHAAVRPMLTRIVAYAADKETAVDIINDAPQAYMVQSWLEDLNGNDDNLPLILTPPVMKLEGKKQGKLRLVVIPAHIPQDRESVYWLAVQEIPPKASGDGGNKLVMAIRSRIKVFVRPTGLKSEEARDAVKQLQWQVEKSGGKTWLTASNPTPYYISFGKLAIKQAGKAEVMLNDKFHMPPPKGSQRYEIPTTMMGGAATLTYSAVNDYGGTGEEQTARVSL
ncbi:fimbrial biogenesis chaperone [Klebsiella spallanzanii]|jgi:chaperone protein EcpD|uniref:fimbrial biogenesis chaperone n=1 Tax=Klebsiella spallanzanii TaxID=2587528 RepID=UPI00111A4F96|nr:molecular chaperone [Klebsiella spallanzanii]MDM4207628.1 molecular chaperone [Klebsiella spallanzanii]